MPNNDPNPKREAPMRSRTVRARELRQTQTRPEATLWKLLRNRQLEGFKFCRQFPIGAYYADFCCRKAKLVVELDGQSHDDRAEYDALRDAALQSEGWRTIRISNRDLIHNPEGAWLSIEALLKENPT